MFEGQVVLVTGASRGIGRAIAEAFAREGARVAAHFNASGSAVVSMVSSLPGSGHKPFQADVGDPKECERLVQAVCDEMGGIDILVNNAGVWEPAEFDALDYAAWQATWQRTLAVDLVGPANLCFLAARVMAERGGGRIVNVSSDASFQGDPPSAAYGAAKAGLNALGQSLAVTLAPHHIFVGTVAPGWVETDMTSAALAGPEGRAILQKMPLGRVGRPEDVAHAVLFLASPGAEFSTGAIIDVNGASYLHT